MQRIRKKLTRKAYWGRFLGFFVVIVLVLGLIASTVVHNIDEKQRADKQYLMESKANLIKDQLQLMIGRVHVMRMILIAQDGQVENFDELAPLVLKGWDANSENFVRNVALAPNSVVTQVYPLEGNEVLVGFDLMLAASESADVAARLEQGQICITPPIELEQGGQGINICLPVTLNGAESPWGMVAIVVDPEGLMQSFGLADFRLLDEEYCLEFVDMKGEYQTIVGNPVKNLPMTHEFQTENLKWRLSVSGKMDKSSQWTAVLLLIGVLIVSFLLASNLANQRQKKQMGELFRDLANTDSVTGCATRHFVYEKLVDKATGKWNYEEMQYSLAILDVDHFKQVNDTYGHEIGDQLLGEIGVILLNALARDKGDCSIRFGGDEFVLLFGNRTQQQLRDVLMHILATVRNVQLPEAEGLQLSISIGAVHPDQMTEEANYKNMLRVADDKLYQAKQGGRNRCVM